MYTKEYYYKKKYLFSIVVACNIPLSSHSSNIHLYNFFHFIIISSKIFTCTKFLDSSTHCHTQKNDRRLKRKISMLKRNKQKNYITQQNYKAQAFICMFDEYLQKMYIVLEIHTYCFRNF